MESRIFFITGRFSLHESKVQIKSLDDVHKSCIDRFICLLCKIYTAVESKIGICLHCRLFINRNKMYFFCLTLIIIFYEEAFLLTPLSGRYYRWLYGLLDVVTMTDTLM